MFELAQNERVEQASAAYWTERSEISSCEPPRSGSAAPCAPAIKYRFPTDHLPEGSC